MDGTTVLTPSPCYASPRRGVILSSAEPQHSTPYTPRRRAPVPCWQHYGGAPWQPRTHANTPRQSGGCGRRTAWAYPWRVGLTITPVDGSVGVRPGAPGGARDSFLATMARNRAAACSAARPNAITPVHTRGPVWARAELIRSSLAAINQPTWLLFQPPNTPKRAHTPAPHTPTSHTRTQPRAPASAAARRHLAACFFIGRLPQYSCKGVFSRAPRE